MRWLSVVSVVALAVAAPRLAAAEAVEKGAFGVGIILGEPTGVAAKLYLGDATAVQAAAGLAFAGGGLQVHADYLWHPWLLEERDSFSLPAYVGPGARFIYYDQGRDGQDFVATGVRAVAGFLFDFKEVPLDAFVEVAGVLEYQFGSEAADGFEVTLNAGAGVRYYF